ncbi:outer membrane protein assembly factor BamA [Acidisoma cellulosilytica]|uniref:Outer membrane protein assembly factor BamA n=1 Tax=Acidisoma cellulosilyticum TaxID=2802395 RepID=A0A963Z0J4_9PROT|nr:outer membrane protein assembly factor BamA [Acidisoma cellulosilyticum]MCB8880474.1 outer membrane protein assembly factor BamA [Acidisoma cellulosilyticum]
MLRTRAALLATACLLPAFVPGAAISQTLRPHATKHARPTAAPAASGNTIAAIEVEGNHRIEAGTIESYMLLTPGEPFDAKAIDQSLKTLYATGLFKNVSITRVGNNLVVDVSENPLIAQVAFEGNHQLVNKDLTAVVSLRGNSVYTPQAAEQDRQAILDAYAHKGYYSTTVVPQIILLPENRVNLVYKIHDGKATFISRIAFVGNKHFSEGALRDVVSSRESAWWRFLSTSDSYDPGRVGLDQDLLGRFYHRSGYPDYQLLNTEAELAPDRSSFYITFVLNEGPRYRIGKVNIVSHLPHLDGATTKGDLQLSSGDWYNGDAITQSVQAITTDVQGRGFAFVQVKPIETKRVTASGQHVVDLSFEINEGPRVFLERIDITGNSRTEDKVIRREFQIAEGDAFNADKIKQSRERLNELQYFKTVDMSTQPGSAPDKIVLTTAVQEQATGSFTIGGGYSTDDGALVDLGLNEKNLIGTGIDAGITGVLAQRASQIDLSVTDPYFLDRNLMLGGEIFDTTNNNLDISQYEEQRLGFTVRTGYNFNNFLSQTWSYSLVDRDVYNVESDASIYVKNEAGWSLLSQVGQSITWDHRDSSLDPHKGYIVRLGTDFAGLGGDSDYVRVKLDAGYYIPLDYFTGNSDWTLALRGGAGKLYRYGGNYYIIDNFFLGGDNMRGFEEGGAGPHDTATGDSLGGDTIMTGTAELHFPLPISKDIGLSGRIFTDIGTLYGVTDAYGGVYQNKSPRVSVGFGFSWNTPFGLINIDIADPVVKYKYDQTQVFRFGFGTNF